LVEDAEAWRVLRPVILSGFDSGTLGRLRRDNILELEKDREAPSFGHSTRRAAAEVFLHRQWLDVVRTEAEGLIFPLARSITEIDSSAIPYLSALAGIRDTASQQGLDPLRLALCDASLRLLGDGLPSPDLLLAGAEQARKSREARLGPVLAGGLFSALFSAKSENNLPRRDALLNELRALSQTFSDDGFVRQGLARGLLNTLYHAKAEGDPDRRDALLNELRAMACGYPDDARGRLRFARGLLSMLNDAEKESDPDRRDGLLNELRGLAGDHPDDSAAREWLVKGLFNTLEYVKLDVGRRDVLLDELRMLARAHPDDDTLREHFAISLYNTLNDAQAEGASTRYHDLLDELRALAHAHPDDAVVRHRLAMGLLIGAKEEGDELRLLALTYPDDATLRDLVARLESK